METHPPDYLLVHPLPAAPNFVGRETELLELRDFWQQNLRGVLALVGLGGAGKTALASRFLEELTEIGSSPRPEGLFLWSFYQEPDAGLFLQEAYHYFAGLMSMAHPAKGVGLLHLLVEALGKGGPYWLVLDGLERVQRQENDQAETFGQIEDPLLKSFLTRVAKGMGATVAMVTSRFPLTDLHPFQGNGYQHLDIGGLSKSAALSLLRQRGVKGDDAILEQLIENYGAHALTLDHLGGLIGQFLEGNPYRAPELAKLSNPSKDRQALRLARLLRAYEDHLPSEELGLLSRLCLLRRSVTEEHIRQFFLCSPSIHARSVREIVDLFQRFAGFEKHLQEDIILDLVASVRATLEEALCGETIAGPEEVFRGEILTVAEKVLELHKACSEMEFGDLARLYANPALENPTDLLPLSGQDRITLRAWYSLYVQMSEHPLMPFQESAAALEQAFQKVGFGNKPSPTVPVELGPADVWKGLKRAKEGLRHLVTKHFALRRVRELCRTYQRKFSLAGPLAGLDAGAMREVLRSLAGRHLVLREADGSFSVHPAVRDHFHHLTKTLDQGAWHDVLRENLVSLVQRPGKRHPEDPTTLDLAEEAMFHALQAGRGDEAQWLYNEVLGGIRQLAWKLGEMNRGLRILRAFNPCPERWDLAWYLRALGEFDQAFACNELPYFRADILLLQGRLPQVAKVGDSTRTPIANFLMGKTTDLPPDQLGGTIPRAQFLLYLGKLNQIGRSTSLAGFYAEIGWEGDRARCDLLLAETARRQTDLVECRKCLDSASRWILHSGSVEHLCLFHLVRSRLARAENSPEAAQLALAEGLHLARQYGLALYHIELLCDQAETLLACGDPEAAEQLAKDALRQASAPECQFQWGAGLAGHIVGQCLWAQKDYRAARDILLKILELRRRIGDPRASATEQLLASLPS